MRKLTACAASLVAAVAMAGCSEVAQEPGKSYAGKEDAKPYSSDLFKGDRAKWETALAQRNQAQNDYLRMPFEKK